MRDIRNGNCPLCDHGEIVEANPPRFGGDGGIEIQAAISAAPHWTGRGRNPRRPVGELRTYFCRDCGFAQTFVLTPDSVPIGDRHKTTLIKGKTTSTPYR